MSKREKYRWNIKDDGVTQGSFKGASMHVYHIPGNGNRKGRSLSLVMFLDQAKSGVCLFSAHAECLLCLSLFHMVLLWHAGWVNVSNWGWGGGEVVG